MSYNNKQEKGEMEIKEIKNKEVWEEFLMGIEEKTFLQSWHWGEFQKRLGNKIWRIGIYKMSDVRCQMSELRAVALVIKVEAKRGRFLFVPHGPVIKSQISNLKSQNQMLNVKSAVLKTFMEELKRIAQKEKCSFIRVAPIWQRSEENKKLFRDLGFRDAPIHIHPELTWQLDIKPGEQELLKQMRKTTRYLVRQGLNNPELKVVKSQEIRDIGVFNKIYQETAKKQDFVPFSFDYLKNEFLSFLPDNQISLFLAEYRGEAIAGAMIIFWQGIAFYHQGASLAKYAKIPASYLLQWEVIKEAKSQGCTMYNFWGIAPFLAKAKNGNPKSQIPHPKFKIQKKHPWYGLTLFKMGFGGYEKAYLKTQDLALTKLYWLNYFIEKLRRLKRGL